MKIFDVSVPISSQIPVWPGDPVVVLERVSSMDAGDHDNVSRLSCSVHTGTHVDAPNHFLNDKRTVESLSLEIMVGRSLVVEIPHQETIITARVLEETEIPEGTIRLLFKTRNSSHWEAGDTSFDPGFVGISTDGAEWLVQKGIKLVGMDYLSVAPFKQGTPTHKILLTPGIVLIEGLNLSAVPPGNYDLYCLPLKLVGSDGAPARVILVQ